MYTMDMSENKWALFNSALDLFYERGYYNVSVMEVTKGLGLGISTSTFYDYFSSRYDVLDAIVKYYQYYFSYFLPSLEEVLERVEQEQSPHIFHEIIYRYPPSLQERMDKIFVLLAIQLYGVPVADNAIDKILFKTNDMYVKAILERLINLGRIEPIDVNAFSLMFSSLCYTSSIKTKSRYPISWDSYYKCFKMLMDFLDSKLIGSVAFR